MYRTVGIVLAGVFITFAAETPRSRAAIMTASPAMSFGPALQTTGGSSGPAAAQDVAAVLGAARGVPALICAFAAQAVWGGGWGGYDAPASPVASEIADRIRGMARDKFSASDVRLLMDSLSSTDPCVRELSVRLIGRQRDESVVSGLVERLGSRTPELREVAALGLGFIEPKSAVDPLVRALRDGTPGVRANSAWALGRIEDGRALRPLVDLFRDESAQVREAATIAVGRMDSSSAVEALIRVVREDASAQVRRSAAWALGQTC